MKKRTKRNFLTLTFTDTTFPFWASAFCHLAEIILPNPGISVPSSKQIINEDV